MRAPDFSQDKDNCLENSSVVGRLAIGEAILLEILLFPYLGNYCPGHPEKFIWIHSHE